MMDILDMIGQEKMHLPRKQRMVAEFMEKNPEVMSYITLKELSGKLQVTEITILNTCQSLGFNGYSDIKYEFRKDTIAKNKTDVLHIQDDYIYKIPSYEITDKIRYIEEIGNEEVSMINQFWKQIDLRNILQAVYMIEQSKKILICGRGVSYSLAQFMVNRLYVCEQFASAINTELNEEVFGTLSELGEETLVIAISFPDYYFMTTKLAELAKKKHAKILLITDDEKAEIADYADFTLTVPSMTRVFMNTLSVPMLLVNVLTSAMKLTNEQTNSGNKEDFQDIL